MTDIIPIKVTPEDRGKCTDPTPKTQGTSLRRAASLNLREKISCDLRTKLIAGEQKYVHAQLTREEKHLKCQLIRLQMQKKEIDQSLDLVECDPGTVSIVNEDLLTVFPHTPEDAECANPYPVTIGRTRKTSTSSLGSSIPWLHRSGRRGSSESEDCFTARSNILPPIQKGQATKSLILSSKEASLHSTSPRASFSYPQAAEVDEHGLWVGDPEAISSIRRCRKSIAQQKVDKMDHKWARSRSLKECGNRSGLREHKLLKQSTVSLNRSHSLRDSKPLHYNKLIGNNSPSNISNSSSVNISVSSSDAVSEINLSGMNIDNNYEQPHITRSSSTEPSLRKKPLFHLGSSPPSKTQDDILEWVNEVASQSHDESVDLKEPEPEINLVMASNRKLFSGTNKLPIHRIKDINVKKPAPSQLSVERCYEILAASSEQTGNQ